MYGWQVIGQIKFYGVHVLGQYFLQSWIGKSTPKPFNVTLTDLDVYIKITIVQSEDNNMKVRFFKAIFFFLLLFKNNTEKFKEFCKIC